MAEIKSFLSIVNVFEYGSMGAIDFLMQHIEFLFLLIARISE